MSGKEHYDDWRNCVIDNATVDEVEEGMFREAKKGKHRTVNFGKRNFS